MPMVRAPCEFAEIQAAKSGTTAAGGVIIGQLHGQCGLQAGRGATLASTLWE